MNEINKWYETLHFYKLTFINDEITYWWTKLLLNEVKENIAKNDFIVVSYGRGELCKEEDINTKVIRSVKDITKEERTYRRERDEDLAKRMRLIDQIRKSKQPFSVQRIIKRLEKEYRKQKESNEWHWQEKASGIHLDVLMYYNEQYLNKLLEKCEKIDLVS